VGGHLLEPHEFAIFTLVGVDAADVDGVEAGETDGAAAVLAVELLDFSLVDPHFEAHGFLVLIPEGEGTGVDEYMVAATDVLAGFGAAGDGFVVE